MARRRFTVLIAVLACAFPLTGCGGSSPKSSTAVNVKSTSEVLYEVVGGQKSASVTFETPTGTSQMDISIPLKKKASIETGITYTFETGDFLYISAQGKGGSNNVICRISVDGTVISENKATGYGIASCKGSA